MKTTGERVRALRDKRGLTREQVAAKAGISVRTLTYVEDDHDTKISTLRAIAAAMGCSLADLFEDAA